jgi:DNA polymerase III delta prime subunit
MSATNTKDSSKEAALTTLLVDLFDGDAAGLRQWVRLSLGKGIHDELPDSGSLGQLAFETMIAIQRHGRIDNKLFQSLQELRPQRAERILGVARLHDIPRYDSHLVVPSVASDAPDGFLTKGRSGVRSTALHPITGTYRERLLHSLARRIQKRLDDTLALEHEVRIELELSNASHAVDNLWRRLHVHGPAFVRTAPAGASIGNIFDEHGGQLLILGAPGAGKTTLLLELAKELIVRAQQQEDYPIPVVVNLASWGSQVRPLRAWLVEALQTAVGVSSKLAKDLAESHDLLLLLDGLDEVKEGRRTECILAINEYVRDTNLVRLAVTSRDREYEHGEAKLQLEGAVHIEPLDVDRVLKQLKGRTASVREAIRTDDALRQLVRTPLMLQIALLAYGSASIPQVKGQSLGERHRVLFDAYILRMLEQRCVAAWEGYERLFKRLHWLHWLAVKMKADGMTEFLLERMQPTWLPSLWQYRLLTGAAVSLITSLVASLFFVSWIILPIGAVFGCFIALGSAAIKPEEHIVWSRRIGRLDWRKRLSFGIKGGGVIGLVLAFLIGSRMDPIEPVAMVVYALSVAIPGGILYASFAGLLVSVNQSMTVAHFEQTSVPNQGINASLRNGTRRVIIIGVVWAMANALPSVAFGSKFRTSNLFVGLFFGLAAGLGRGLGAYVKHYVLRFMLLCLGKTPLDYVAFLEQAVYLLFLQRNGGLYQFRHLSLRDYFAGLTPESIRELASKSVSRL